MRSSRKASGEVNNNFEKKLAENIKKDSKSFFAYVCGRSQATRKVGPLTDNGGKLVESSDGMSELFNEWMNENAMILSAFENRLTAGFV